VDHLAFPTIEHARLSNGIEVVLARRTAVPKLLVNVDFDAGVSGDALDTPGTQGMLLAMLDEGTARMPPAATPTPPPSCARKRNGWAPTSTPARGWTTAPSPCPR
jgi:predicted Zn-dependent peptidase